MRITSKGQVTIPQEIREQCGLLPHTEVRFVVEHGRVLIEKDTPALSRSIVREGGCVCDAAAGRSQAGSYGGVGSRRPEASEVKALTIPPDGSVRRCA